MTCQETSEGVLAFHPSVNLLDKIKVISKVDNQVCIDIPDWKLNIIVEFLFGFLLYELTQVVKTTKRFLITWIWKEQRLYW